MGYGSFHLNTSYKSAACLRLTSFYALTMKNLKDKKHITLSLLVLLCLIRVYINDFIELLITKQNYTSLNNRRIYLLKNEHLELGHLLHYD